MSKTLVIMQGIPGSGKSTVAKGIRAQTAGVILSTDEFWYEVTKDGVSWRGEDYNFDPTRITEAHEWNQMRADHSMAADSLCVIIDNTNIKREHVLPYLVLAAKYGYTVQVVRVETDPALAASRNTHNVPVDTVFRMHAEMEDLI